MFHFNEILQKDVELKDKYGFVDKIWTFKIKG